MNKTKRGIILISMMIIATAFMLIATYMENLDRNTRILVSIIYGATMIITNIVNLIYVFKDKK